MLENEQSFHVEHPNRENVPRETSLIEIAACPLCGAQEHASFLKATDHTVTKRDFYMRSCNSCGFVFTSPQPSPASLPAYYESDAYVSHSETKKGIINRLYHIAQVFNLRSKFRLSKKFAPEGPWADYGSGAGAFAKYANDHSVQITGYEPSESARAAAMKKGITSLPLDQFSSSPEFACITLWHVLEHIPQLMATLESLKSAMIQGGVLVLAVPNHKAHDARIYAEHWAAYDLPRHLWHFTEKDMRLIAQKLNMTLLSVRPMYFDALYVSMLSEQYRGGNKLKGVLNGILSNIKALTGGAPYSSQIYILRK